MVVSNFGSFPFSGVYFQVPCECSRCSPSTFPRLRILTGQQLREGQQCVKRFCLGAYMHRVPTLHPFSPPKKLDNCTIFWVPDSQKIEGNRQLCLDFFQGAIFTTPTLQTNSAEVTLQGVPVLKLLHAEPEPFEVGLFFFSPCLLA